MVSGGNARVLTPVSLIFVDCITEPFSPKMKPPQPQGPDEAKRPSLTKTGSHCLSHPVCLRLHLSDPRVLPPVGTESAPRYPALTASKPSGDAVAKRGTPRRAAHGLLATRPLMASWPGDDARRPVSAQNDTSELAAHSGWVLPTDGGSSLAGSVSLLHGALHYLVGMWLARALRPHSREVHVGREALPLPIRTPVAWVSVAVRTAWPREPSPARLRQECLCPP